MLRSRTLVALLAPAAFAATLAIGTPESSAAPRTAAVGRMDAPGVLLLVAKTGNEARYRIRERLASMDLPYDAVGKSKQITGAISIGPDGNIIREQSRIRVDISDLTSDKPMRDRYVQRRLLESKDHPRVELAPVAIRGLTGPIPTTGTRTFDLIANLTVKGVTRPTTWRVTALFDDDKITGTASTSFTFKDFGLTQPKVPMVLSLADTIKLEYDFNFDRHAGAATVDE